MKLICAPNGLVDIRYPRQGMLDITGAGFTESVLDFSMCVPPDVLEKSNGQAAAENFEKSAERLIQAFQEHNLKFSVALAPYLLPETKRQDLNALMEQLAVCCIKLCGKYGCGKLIIRPLFCRNRERRMVAGKSSILHEARANGCGTRGTDFIGESSQIC